MKASKATVRARVEDLARVILDGATPWQIRQYVTDQEAAKAPPWTRPEGCKGLSSRQIHRYCERADALIAESYETDREKLLRRHMAQRQNLYARALQKGDDRTALAVLRDQAELQGLYPAAKVKAEHTGAKGGPIEHQVNAQHEHHFDTDPDRMAAILRALAEASAIDPSALGATGDAPSDEVHPAPTPSEAGGIPPAELP